MYVINIDQDVRSGYVFSAGDAGLASTNALGEAAAADHTATKPSLILINPSGSGVTATLLSLLLTQAGTVAGGRPEVMLGYDEGNMYSSGGAQITPICRMPGINKSAMLVYQAQSAALLTGVAATAKRRYLDQREFLHTVSAVGDVYAQWFDFGGTLLIPAGWSFLVFCRAATTGLTFHWNLDYREK